jgi:RNA polymerase sigma factor (sigma-70 family)
VSTESTVATIKASTNGEEDKLSRLNRQPMSSEHHDFQDLMKQVDDGSESAARELLERYGSHVVRAIRSKLHRDMRSRFDSCDFYQTVWKSFFARNVPTFNDERELIAYLRKVATNKVIERFRQLFQTKKYDVTREERFDVALGDPDGFSERTKHSLLKSRDPTPSQVVSAEEQAAQLRDRDPLYHQIVKMKAEGATLIEIASATGVHERTVRRVIKRISNRVEL